MGKPKKGGYPPPQPITHYIEIIDGKINPAAVTIAWGDCVVWTNKDAVSYTLALFTNGEPIKTKSGARSPQIPPRRQWNLTGLLIRGRILLSTNTACFLRGRRRRQLRHRSQDFNNAARGINS